MKEKKSAKKIIIIGTVIAVIVLGLICGIMFLKTTKKGGLLKAASDLILEISDTTNQYGEEIDLSKLLNLYQSGNFEASYNMTVKLSAFPKEITLDGVGYHDQDNKLLQMDAELSISSSKVADVDIYADEENMYLFMPDLLDGSLVLPTKEYGKAYQNSVLAKMQGQEVAQDTQIELFPEIPQIGGSEGSVTDLYRTLVIKSLTRSDVQITENKKSDGTLEYKVVLPKEILEEIIDQADLDTEAKSQLKQYFPKESFEYLVSLDEQNRIERIDNEELFCVLENGEAFSFAFLFIRDEKGLSSYQANVDLSSIQLNYEYTYEDSHYDLECNFMQDNIQQKVAFAGKLAQEDEWIQAKVEKFSYKTEEANDLSLNGLVKMKELTTSISIPDTTPEYHLFEMSELDYAGLISKVGVKIIGALLFM